MTTLDLYHRTSEDAARAIVATGRFLTRENTPEAYVSTHVDGEAAGYGSAVVHVRVDEADAQLEDEFPTASCTTESRSTAPRSSRHSRSPRRASAPLSPAP